ncbi:MAG: hypothetical protein ACI9BD_000246 [Candidatus Marinamargulisbacteria bacterium]|jgi:hypothetical protein
MDQQKKDNWLFKKACEDKSVVNNATFLTQVENPEMDESSPLYQSKLKYRILSMFRQKQWLSR